MSIVIDRRLNAKKKSTVNRQRFLRRYKNHVKKAVEQVVNQRSITDVDRGGEISIPTKDLSEPFFHHGEGGATERVYPGNKDFNSGDRFARPRGGGGGGGAGEGQASDGGEGMDDFVFQIDREELLEYLFEDLELPNLVEKELKESSDYKLKRAGFTNAGSPDKINIIRSLRGAHARRIALSGKERKEIRELKREIREMEVSPETTDKERVEELRARIRELNAKIKRLPFIDEFDLKFNNMVKVPNPSSKAVMFCVMDVSGSMTRDIKDMAKRFFMLLYMFLERSYETVELVFIRHHAEARECNEHDFFYARETGGTVVSSALKLSNEIIDERYSPKDWNIYVAQASDGDNWEADCAKCDDLIRNKILSKVQFFSYVEITDRHHQALWHDYKAIEDEHPDRFAIQHIQEPGDIYPVFRKLFEKREA
ncbi:YeaH/YhbH family protein [Endozoicomonadaceae bacterium StTr2]